MSEPLVGRQDAIEQLRKADQQWASAVKAFDSYPVRLRTLAEAAKLRSRALMLGDLANLPLKPRPGAAKVRALAYELGAGSDRPGPKGAWQRFDHATKELGAALETGDILTVARAFDEISTIADDLADACEDHLESKSTKAS